MNSATLLPPDRRPIRPALPPRAHLLSGRRFKLSVPPLVRSRLRHPPRLPVSEWTERYRVVTDGAHVGPWQMSLAPHTRKVMDTYSLPWVREVWFCGVEQSGKTNTMLSCLAWAVECDPGSIFYLMPTEDTAAKVTGGKIRPMLLRSPRLSRYLPAKQDDLTLSRITLRHGVSIFPAWANSPSVMATWAAKHCFGDEVDKYPAQAGQETDPISLIRKRTRTYQGRDKHFFASTPAGRYIHRGTYACDQVWVWQVKCPACGSLQRMDASHLVPPAGYACGHCGSVWGNPERAWAIRQGGWECIQGADLPRPARVGFHHRAWECLDIPLEEIAKAWQAAQGTDIAARVSWANGYEAIDYREEVGEAPELLALAERAEEYAPVVPLSAAILTAGVDVHPDRLEIEVVAWGMGAESWGMDYQVLHGDTRLTEVWEQLDRYLLQRWEHASGEHLAISRVFIDSGYIPHQVARFCAPRRARGIYAVKGASNERAPELGGPSRQRHGSVTVQVYTLGTNRLKTQMFAYFALGSPGPGYCHLPLSYPGQWYEMLTTERVVAKPLPGGQTANVWLKIDSHARNESIDLRVYALAALMSMRVDIKGHLAALRAAAQRRVEPPPRPAPRKKGFVKDWK